jgi:hypothetical protein
VVGLADWCKSDKCNEDVNTWDFEGEGHGVNGCVRLLRKVPGLVGGGGVQELSSNQK